MTSLVVFTKIARFISLTFVCVSWSKKMSDIEVLSRESSSERSEVVSSSKEEDGGHYFELNGILPIWPMMIKTKMAFCLLL